MSVAPRAGNGKITVPDILSRKSRSLDGSFETKQKITCLTAYDYPTARLLDDAGVDVLLVGDSLGMAVLGYDSTLPVTVDDILYHTRAVRRGDHYVISGRKIWTSTAQVTEKMLILTRTTAFEESARPSQGMTLFYTDLDRNKVEVRRIRDRDIDGFPGRQNSDGAAARDLADPGDGCVRQRRRGAMCHQCEDAGHGAGSMGADLGKVQPRSKTARLS